jgi:crotonobetainyl-CoA:carnitine CoA-transferase CaiB-like acyl-CoA transferase
MLIILIKIYLSSRRAYVESHAAGGPILIDTIETALRCVEVSAQLRPSTSLCREGQFNADFPVSTLASASVCAAVSALQSLCEAEFGHCPEAVVDGVAVDHWCTSSVTPMGWSLPLKWDAFSRDYQTRDGWIRLHTNAPHHRKFTLNVLGTPATPEAAANAIAKWSGDALEKDIVDAGGCAAKLRTVQEWQNHPQGSAIGTEPIIGWNEVLESASRWSPESMKRPLSGLRILDLTRVLAGPVATRFLASVGADVLRIDPPNWDEDGNAIEMTVGKTCAGLDLTDMEDRKTFSRLVGSADVLVHGYRADALDRLGFGIERCRTNNPSLITVGLNAYGWQGQWIYRRGFDSLVQRSAGLAKECNGSVKELPYQVLDHATGYMMAAAVLHAVRIQRASDRVLSAKLSLARQAKLLVDHMGLSNPGIQQPDACRPRGGSAERTDWGQIWRLALPYHIKGVETGWDVDAHMLRTDKPAWRNKKENSP